MEIKFKRKADLLRWLGKDPKDVRLISRKIQRGEIVYEDGEYVVQVGRHVMKLIELIFSLCESEEEQKLMEKKIYDVLYHLSK